MFASQLPFANEGQLPLIRPYIANVTPVITPPAGHPSCKVGLVLRSSAGPTAHVAASSGCAGSTDAVSAAPSSTQQGGSTCRISATSHALLSALTNAYRVSCALIDAPIIRRAPRLGFFLS
eukprot:SAG31_NODE_7165_length_1769_cov_1.417365_2_plen_121_part_00